MMIQSLFGLLAAITTLASPVIQKRDCTGQHIFHSPKEGDAAMNKQNWADMGFTPTDMAIMMKEDAGRPTVQEDEDGAPGHFAFTIFNMNWWMVKISCPEYVPPGFSPSSSEDQIPPEIFQKLNNDQSAALSCLHKTMNDPFYNKDGEAPTSQDNPSPAWWAAQRGGPTAAQNYLAGQGLDPVVSDYMWNTLGIRDWIVKGNHMTDDWIESSCLSGEWNIDVAETDKADHDRISGLTAPAPCPTEFSHCGAGYL